MAKLLVGNKRQVRASEIAKSSTLARLQSGRQTLENTIVMVESNPEWRARVVYGDTDSLFVLLPGRSSAEAFRIGAEIAAQATTANPPPVVLKMEKARPYDATLQWSTNRSSIPAEFSLWVKNVIIDAKMAFVPRTL